MNYALSNNNEEVKIFIDKELMTTIAAMGPAIAELIPDDPDALGSFGPMIKLYWETFRLQCQNYKV